MKYFQAVSIISALAGLTSAAPAAEPRQVNAVITFSGASSSYTLTLPVDGSVFNIHNGLAVDTISSLGGAACSFITVDSTSVTVYGSRSVIVAPPQAIVSGRCIAT